MLLVIMLWFDVEQIQETTRVEDARLRKWLWFDVEQIQETTNFLASVVLDRLWFDVEQIQETTSTKRNFTYSSCGLM